ncbi:MAG: tRNA (guanosine(46)-N7)-methyltransferase TrmB [Treponema sp.]|jgi:tRNA (guanine-N7-)-methyltransferase|nr:tRNA (guanosine(46)-N7)-methyltransferase TrmB [Treponema sp.]
MTDAQQRAIDTLLPIYKTALPEQNENDFEKIFGNANPIIVEIGFGMGEATAIIAENNPSLNYLGIEVHTPGIGRLLMEIERRGLENIRIITCDAVEAFNAIKPESVSGIHLFFPDPWPKKRHHKRRIIQKPFTDTLASKLKAAGYLYMVTDWAEYADAALAELSTTAGLKNAYDHFAPPQTWRPKTKFEKRALSEGREIKELFFTKTSSIKLF